MWKIKQVKSAWKFGELLGTIDLKTRQYRRLFYPYTVGKWHWPVNGADEVYPGIYLGDAATALCTRYGTGTIPRIFSISVIEGQSPIVIFKIWTFCWPFLALGNARAHELLVKEEGWKYFRRFVFVVLRYNTNFMNKLKFNHFLN